MPLNATPVSFTEKPWAFCRNNEPRLPMLLPVKSRKQNASAAATKNPAAAGLPNNFSERFRSCGAVTMVGVSSASHWNNAAHTTPRIPISSTGVRQSPDCAARQPE
jgi:hypothetical protein